MTETSDQFALGAEDEQESETEGRPPLTLIVGLVLALLGGMVLVGVAGALETTDDCSSGGYNCVDYEDAQLFVDPATNLVDRQTVQVTGTDFDPHFASMGIAQCAAAFVEIDFEDACFIPGARILTVDGSGSVATELTVRRIITTAAGGETDCAEPNACEISGGTFDGAEFDPVEGDRVPVHFDPTVPPVPPLELEVTIDEASADSISGTVSCNRAATINLDAELIQERGNRMASAYGYFYGDTTCDTDPAPWTVQLMPGQTRLVGGPATATVYGYAYDGFESAFDQVEQAVRLRGGPRSSFVPMNVEGDTTTVRILGQPTDGGIIVQVDCGRPNEYVTVNANVMQWAGLDLVTASGYGTIEDCDGVEEIILTLSANGGVLVGGPAHVQVTANAHNHTGDFYHDYAQQTDVVRLSGQIRPDIADPVPNPDSRIVIDRVTRTAITGTVECESPAMVDLSGSIIQLRDRTLNYSSAYSFIECDGATSFSLDVAEYGSPPQGGWANVVVSAYAYQIVEMDDYDYYEFLWDDHQQARERVRNP